MNSVVCFKILFLSSVHYEVATLAPQLYSVPSCGWLGTQPCFLCKLVTKVRTRGPLRSVYKRTHGPSRFLSSLHWAPGYMTELQKCMFLTWKISR